MQKLDLRNNLYELIQELKSDEIVQIMSATKIDKKNLLRLVIDSKSGYERSMIDQDRKKIGEEFNIDQVYKTSIFSEMISFISQVPNNQNTSRTNYLNNNNVNNFFSFQKTLIYTFNILDKLLISDTTIFNDSKYFDTEIAEKNGNLLLQIVEESNIDLNTFNEITKSIQSLVETIYRISEKIDKEVFEYPPMIGMIDSGSDICISIKIPEKAVNTIAEILKQFWDLTINNKMYRNNQKLKTLSESLDIIEKINQAKDQKNIEPEEAEILKRGVLENAEKNCIEKYNDKENTNGKKRNSNNRNLMIEKGKLYQLLDDNSKNDDAK